MKPYAAIDFGTSNSAAFVGIGANIQPILLEHGREVMPTAIFFNSEDRTTTFGRRAVTDYQTGCEGRLMRSLKSLLASDLIHETTLINGSQIAYPKIIGAFLAHIKEIAESHVGEEIPHIVLGRPIHFIDDDPVRDARAEATLSKIAHDVGFSKVRFQYEPIAAALDYEKSLFKEELVLIVDIGGGTSDFSVIRLGPLRSHNIDRTHDMLGSAGIHIAGTDFDRELSLAAVMPYLGFGGVGNDGKIVPSSIYFELATWHRINFLYAWKSTAEAQGLRPFFKDEELHDRLMKVLRKHQGHRIASLVEDSKVQVADGGEYQILLDFLEPGLVIPISNHVLISSIESRLEQIVETAIQSVREAQLPVEQISAVYFTGGSTGIRLLRDKVMKAFPNAKVVEGERFSSVARGLGLFAANVFGQPSSSV